MVVFNIEGFSVEVLNLLEDDNTVIISKDLRKIFVKSEPVGYLVLWLYTKRIEDYIEWRVACHSHRIDIKFKLGNA